MTGPSTVPGERLGPERSAVVVVDVQNDYCAPGGVFDRAGGRPANVESLVASINRLVEAARLRDVPVAWVRTVRDRQYYRSVPERPDWPLGPRGHCLAGTWGAELLESLHRDPTDIYVEKRTRSAFAGTELGSRLRAMRREVVVLGGCATEVCVESTVRSAADEGLVPVVVRDAVSSHDAQSHEASLRVMARHFAQVVPADHVMSWWGVVTQSGSTPQRAD